MGIKGRITQSELEADIGYVHCLGHLSPEKVFVISRLLPNSSHFLR
jgi:hypothetical protein